MNFVNLSNYDKLEFLGQGSFGAVFKIRHKESGELFAAKISSKYHDSNNDQEFINIESKMDELISLNHPSVIKYEGFSQHDFFGEPRPVIVMEFALRNSIQKQINDERESPLCTFDDTRKLVCIYGIASGMQYLHSKGIIHCNLNPSNILLTEKQFPKISDFGLLQQLHSNKDNMTNYCSPEIFLANLYSKASDVYAFGMTVYAMITSEIPFSGLNPDEIKRKVINNERPTIPHQSMNPACESLILRCCSQDPSERPSFEEIVNELENNESFLSEAVDRNEYFNYINYLKEYLSTSDSSKRDELTQHFYQKLIKDSQHMEHNHDTHNDQHHFNQFGANVSEDRNQETSCEDVKIAADQGDSDAMYNYGLMLYKGEGIEMNKEEACRYYKMAADKGQIKAMFNYGLMLYKGEGVSMNKEEACRYFKMAADKGEINSMNNYGLMLYNGEGVSMNKREACRYYKMAADQGHPNAMCTYGVMLDKGEGVSMNKEEACRYYKMAADKGYVEAMMNYATMLYNGDGIVMNKQEACRYYKMAADQGYINAMSNYGVMLEKGEGVEMNKEEACRYYKMAADKGDVHGMFNYGWMLFKGEGVEMNKEEACRYYKMAADRGDINGMANYGIMLERGEGVRMNKQEAYRYYKMAADQGQPSALYNLGRMSKENRCLIF